MRYDTLDKNHLASIPSILLALSAMEWKMWLSQFI